jgi:dTDP-4-dehydrorhamnose reductase
VKIGRVLITGGAGQLASDLREGLSGSAEVDCRDRAALDITDDAAVEQAMEEASPDVVFNCAAYHKVDELEGEEDRAAAVNVRAVKRLAERCAERGAKLVHFSTNYVFDGTASEPYTERDLPNPRSVYALSKLAGEYAARAYEPGALVVRSAGLYGLAGSDSKGGNFVERLLARVERGEPVKMVEDQRLTPTFTADLAGAVVAAVEADASEVLHLTNGGSCSWHEFTLAILDQAGHDVPVEAVATAGRPGMADRPLNGVLANEAAESLGLAPLRPWRAALDDYMQRAGLTAGGER